jgi:APA family basic amino acid/polyamine antiporter
MTKPTLLRALGPWSSVSVVAGSVIGSGVFLVAADIARAVPSPAWGLTVWVVAGLLTYLGGLVFSELGAMLPGAGGQYVYLREAFGPRVGFLFSWTHILILAPGTVAALAVAFGQFTGGVVSLSDLQSRVLASLAIIALTWLNLRGVMRAAHVLNALTSLKVLSLVALALVGLGFYFAGVAPAAAAAPAPFTAASYGVALIAAFWAYDGWSGLAQVAGEVDQPQRNIPFGYIAGLGLVGLLYVGVNFMYSRVLGPEQIATSTFVAADAAQAVGGAWARGLIGVAVVISTLGCLNAAIMTGARAAYAVAEDSVFPAMFRKLDPTTRVPGPALILQGAMALLLTWSGSYNQLFTYVVAAAFIFYATTALSLLRLRRTQPERARPYRVPLYPFLPLAYVALCAVFIFNTFWETPRESVLGLVIVALGLPAFRLLNRRASAPRIFESVT